MIEVSEKLWDRFAGWMEVLNDAVEEGRITPPQARSLLVEIARKADYPWA